VILSITNEWPFEADFQTTTVATIAAQAVCPPLTVCLPAVSPPLIAPMAAVSAPAVSPPLAVGIASGTGYSSVAH